ncbi:hypothetical protein O6H91_11G078400 [Diphasiastrum complanatum]|uniref:Uncharacterized protein n=1 Tax=Diphasiastrum complanatum TaxID=34168 RepID=A0ACC2CAY9_DIPCM|nr:hypothetical protein O6H91_11G078400 [Diphasiastrum complanatum]
MTIKMEMEDMLAFLQNYKQAREENIAPENPDIEALLAAMDNEGISNAGINIPGSSNECADDQYEEIFPAPFFVVKTTNEKSQKILVNVCGSAKISAPGNWEEGVPKDIEDAINSINDEHNESNAMHIRFPLSCSEPITSLDKNGSTCWVYDVVYNESVLRQAMSHKTLKLFVIEMALTWIGQKYKIQLVSGFKLPNLKYKGPSVRRHHIRASPKLLVTELPDLQPSFPLLACSTSENSGKNPLENLASELSSRAAGVTESFSLPPDTSEKEVLSTCIQPPDIPSVSSFTTPSPHSTTLLQSPDALFSTSLQSSSLPGTVGISTAEEPLSSCCCTSSLKFSSDGTQNDTWQSTSATLADLPSLLVDEPSDSSSLENPYKPANIVAEPKSNLVNDCKGKNVSKFAASCSKEMSKGNVVAPTSVIDEQSRIWSCHNEENDDQQMQEANYDIQMQGTMTKMEYYGYPVDEVDIHVNLAPLVS